MTSYLTEKCRSCSAPIIWTTTANGKPMPVNAMPSATGNVMLGCDHGKTTAEVLGRNRAAGARDNGVPLHVSHFVDCPHAKAHRRTR